MKELFLALLSGEQAHGYELKQSLEQELGDLSPALNAGQIYMTLGRLERDGLVLGHVVPGDNRGKRLYELTDKGRATLEEWIEKPVSGTRLKDEFFMKFLVLVSAGLADPRHILDGQRQEYLQSLRDLNAQLEGSDDRPAVELLLGGAILHVNADLEWLELIEERLREREDPR